MKAQCEAAVRAAAGAAKLTKADLDGIESRIVGAMKTLRRSDPSAWAKMDTAARMNAAAKLARERYVESVARGAARLADRLSKKARNDAAIAAVKPGKNGRLAALDRSLFYEGAERGGTTSLEKDIQATIAMFWRKLEGEHSLVMQAPEKQAAIYDELFGKDSGDPQAKAAAKAVRAAMDEMFEAAQHAGIADNPLENWTLPQKRDWTRMGDRETWIKKQMERLDLSEFVEPDGSQMSPERIRETLEESFATLATNGANKLDGQGGKGKLGVRGPRQLHYKDGASLKAEMDDYGYGFNLKEIVRSHIRSVARDLAIADREGYMADTDVAERAAAAHAADLAAVTSAHDKRTIEKTYTKFKRNWQVLRRGSVPGNARWANAMRLVRSVMSSSMLGASNALPDPGMAAVYLNSIHLNIGHFLQDMGAGMVATKANRFRIGQAGIFMEGLHDAAQRFGEDTFAPTARAANFLNHGVYVGSSLRMWDRGQASGIGGAVMRTLGEHLHKMPDDFEKLDAPSLDYLRRKGVTQELWQTWRLADLDKGPDGNAPMLTPDSIAEIPDEKLEPIARAKLGAKASDAAVAAQVRALRRDAQVKLLSSIYTDMQAAGRGFSGMSIRDQVDQGYDRLEAGTFMGELIRTLVMIRQVPIGIFKTHMLDVPKRFDSRLARWMYRAKFLAATTLLGGLGVQLKNIAFGADPDNMQDPKFWAKALAASGGLGLYGDALFSPANSEHPEGLATKIAGPLGTATDDFTKIFMEAKADPAKFTDNRWQGELLRFVRNNATPFMRLWYVRAAFDHLVYQQMQEMLNPGYNERVRHRMLHPGGDQAPRPTWWSPGETQPERAPDLGAAVGQPTQ